MLNKFSKLEGCDRIWAIGSIHGNVDSIQKIHKVIFSEFKANDTIIYLGNVIGVGPESSSSVNEILKFRAEIMGKFKLKPNSFIFLRGAQEEMLTKLLELHLSPNPKEILTWMHEHGVDKTLSSYGMDIKDLYKTCELGTVLISKWTTKAKNLINNYEGHSDYFSYLVHASFPNTEKILFVNRGVDTSRPLSAQNDCFWWGFHNFSKTSKPYYNFKKLVRGYDPKKTGPNKNEVVCSLYKGSGFGGPIVAGLFSSNADIIDIIER